MKAKTVEELHAARKEATLDFSRMLELEFTELLGKKCTKLEDLRKEEVAVMAPEWFNNNKQFWRMQKRLFDTYRDEMDRETRNCDLRAKRQAEWRKKLVLLKKALELAPR
eukprot:3601131-Rhodomonas_salina.2